MGKVISLPTTYGGVFFLGRVEWCASLFLPGVACLILENDNGNNGIVLNPFDGDPIVGEVKEREGARSGRWRFIEVEWRN